MNASGIGAVFCKYLEIMHNLKKQVRGRNIPKTRGFAKSRPRVSTWLDAPCCQQGCPGEQPWYSTKELLQPQHPRSKEALPTYWGKVWAVLTIQLRCVETPYRWRIKACISG